jgi:sporulation protein YlmC with PRC-barrel domain
MKPHTLSTSTLTGTNVENLNGDKLGSVKDLMIDLESGQVLYAVLSHGGFLGIGTDYFAVPMQAFKYSQDDDQTIRLDADDDTLDNAPGFDKDNWPSTSSNDFTDRVYKHYGYERGGTKF